MNLTIPFSLCKLMFNIILKNISNNLTIMISSSYKCITLIFYTIEDRKIKARI